MRISKIHVQNFRALRNLEIPVSPLTCIIGENNAGKSSILTALNLFITGSVVQDTDFYDPSKEIRISVELSEIATDDLDVLAEEHRTKVAPLVKNESLTLVRVYGTDRKSKLRFMKQVPREARFATDAIDGLLKGKRVGEKLLTEVVAGFPELVEKAKASTSAADYRSLIDELADSLPIESKDTVEADLPTGIDKSIAPLLPEPIFIRAAKDLDEDMKTKDSAAFGKVLSVLLDAIEPRLTEEKQLFEKLNRKLNRVQNEDGTVADDREEEVREIEGLVQKYVQESFPRVSLEIEIPPPQLKVILSSAHLMLDDGVRGDAASKGDGLRRAIVFAILRSYLDFAKRRPANGDGKPSRSRRHYLLLFEEPELYLHPSAQRILFEALNLFGKTYQVVFTTHSPAFLGPDSTGTFIKLGKRESRIAGEAPYAHPHPVDLTGLRTKDQFQIICYENNTAAFFADTIILVEGDSDLLVLQHVARLLHPDIDHTNNRTAWARVNGKSSIRRYQDFFAEFGARVVVFADLDILLDGLAKLDIPEDIQRTRASLLQHVDAALVPSATTSCLSGDQLANVRKSGTQQALWRAAKDRNEAMKAGKGSFEAVAEAVDEFFAVDMQSARLYALAAPPNTIVATAKAALLGQLRDHDVFVLERGSIEAYYPPDLDSGSADKVTKARAFCEAVATRDDLLAISGGQKTNAPCEFELIFSKILEATQGPPL